MIETIIWKRIAPALLALSASFLMLNAQNAACVSTCTGNLGDNIFPDGDFGSGIPNVLPYDPGLAPGYSYQLNPPPNDGAYCIANNTTNWGSFAALTWIKIKDHSSDPNGYMMVVNASYSPGLFYRKTVSICENTLYELSVDLICANMAGFPGIIQPNVAFLVNSVVVCATNNIPVDEQWYRYKFSFTSAPGQTFVTFALRNNAPGGYGNDLFIDNISFRACGPELGLPAEDYFCPGHLVTLSATMQNSPYNTAYFLWQVMPPGSMTWMDLPGSSGTSYTVQSPQDSAQYRLLVANSAANLAFPSCRAVSYPTEILPDILKGYEITGQDTIVCNGAPAGLQTGSFAAYKWSTGAMTDSILAPKPGWYAVTVTSSHGCTAHDSLFVRQVDLTGTAGWTDPVCYGDSTGTVTVQSIKGGVGPIRFSLDNGPDQNTPVLTHLSAGDHRLILSDSLNCRFPIPFLLVNPPQDKVFLEDDRTFFPGDSVLLSSSENFKPVAFKWSPAARLSCANCAQTLASPSETTTYLLTAKDSLGCTAVDSITLTKVPRLDVYGPNIFKPDFTQNLANNYFTVFASSSAVMVRRMEIYDRWGDLIFSRKDLPPGDPGLRWDGTGIRGKRMETGVYVWLAEVAFFDGAVRTYNGNVTLWR
jgi:hypothetical protein